MVGERGVDAELLQPAPPKTTISSQSEKRSKSKSPAAAEERNLPSGTSSSPLSVAMIAVVEEEELDQAQLDLVIDYRGVKKSKKGRRVRKRAATGVKRRLESSRFVRPRKMREPTEPR